MNDLNNETPLRADLTTQPSAHGLPLPYIAPARTDDSGQPTRQRRAPEVEPTRQFAALFLAPVNTGASNVSELKLLLETIAMQTSTSMRGEPDACALLPLHKLASVHYARLVLIEEWAGLGPMLVFATDYDGPAGVSNSDEASAFAHHLDELCELGDGLHRIFRHCSGYRDRDRLKRYLRKHRVRSATSFIGAPGRSRDQILWEAELRRRVSDIVAASPRETDPEGLRDLVLKQLKGEGWSLRTFPEQPRLTGKLVRALFARAALVFGAVTVALWSLRAGFGISPYITGVFALVALALVVARFRRLELSDPQFQPKLDQATHERLRAASAHENDFLQNQLTHLVAIKPGLLRRVTIAIVFHVLQPFATYRYNRGKLGDIPSIHFARWALIPGRGVLFLSNFDNSWQSYLGDFIDKASSGLTAVWSNTVGYPRSTWLMKAGSQDASRFLAWTRAHQLPTQVWYSAYPELSIVNINDNTEIRRGLADPSCMDARTWQLRVHGVDRIAADEEFSRAQTSEPPVRLERVQGLIVRGYSHMPDARYLMLRVRAPLKPCALEWIGKLELTSAAAGARAMQSKGPLLNIAFSYEGLRALGVNGSLCDSFSTAFVRGAHDKYRARVNGDIGDNAPECWQWGASSNLVHVLLSIFAESTASAEGKAEELKLSALEHGFEPVTILEGSTLPGRKEHFGFRDGIGQPQIRGCGGTDQESDAIAAGEFFLGHRDGYGNCAYAPESPNGFSFGHDGSYLVFRQLEQDVPAFWRYCAQLGGGAQGAIGAAAKLVGRWPSGASLVRHPDSDPMEGRFEDEDDFNYLANDEDNDRYGERCPFGAHIRRTNPRDWNLGATREKSLELSNLHRIVRRGRPYGVPLDAQMSVPALVEHALRVPADERSGGRGLQFLCFNANIERQFELIQQHWCNNPHFAGMDSEPDALLSGKQSFVRVIGGTYFFMPSLSAVRLLANGSIGNDTVPGLENPPPDEQIHIDSLMDNLRRKATSDYATGSMLRAAHPKTHGCAEIRFRVERNLPQELSVGLFAKPASYVGWMRFSNERVPPGPDSAPGIRGAAIKLENVNGAKLLDGEEFCTDHDFVLISTDAFVTKDAAEFDALIKSLMNGTALFFFLRHPRSLWNLFVRAAKRFGDVLDITYFSPTPYLLGARAVKYMLRPTHPSAAAIPPQPSADYLREVLAQRLEREAVTFDFLVQLQSDLTTMPIEDPRVVWKQSRSVFHKVATVELLRQQVDTQERREYGEWLSFNPWRCLPEHRPLGGVNRARRQVYRALSRFRHDRDKVSVQAPRPSRDSDGSSKS
jgi:Dyp-type peroxidase family